MTRVIVSLTTTPSRISGILPTLVSISKQSPRPEETVLFLPKKYKRWPNSMLRIPKELTKYCRIEFVDTDYGPATKILPAVKEYLGKDVLIVYCDDDQIYKAGWLEALLTEAFKYENTCIACDGDSLLRHKKVRMGKGVLYRLLRVLSFGIYKPMKKRWIASEVDIVKGYGGVVVRPSFFPDDVFNIPEIVWLVDDVWLSANMKKNGITLRMLANGSAYREKNLDNQSESLLEFVHNGHDRASADLFAIEYVKKRFGIWASS